MGPLAVLVTLVCITVPVYGDTGCSALRHLDNGQTFFRYGGLLVIFHCNPGYKLHGYKTNSCVSGHWSRDPPVCVGSGCSDPGVLIHGTSSTNEDGSWAVFRCNRGFHLHGPSMLYCKGRTWNSTKPICKETDMMSSFASISAGKSSLHQNLQTSAALQSQQHSFSHTLTNAASKEVDVKFHLLPSTPTGINSSERSNVTKPETLLKMHHRITSLNVQDVTQANQGTGWPGSEDKVPHEEPEKLNKVTTVSSALSPMTGTEHSTFLLSSFSSTHTPAVTTSTNGPHRQTSRHHYTNVSPPKLGFGEAATHQENVTLSEVVTTGNKVQPTDQSHTATYVFPTSPSSTPISSPAASSFPFSSSTQSNMKAQFLKSTTLLSNISTNADLSSIWTENRNITINSTFKPILPYLNFSRRSLCPYPPVPAHGTFYFRNVENADPGESRHYIQYVCDPGYTLAHGDVHSYCQQGGTWSGVTPVCLDLTPCSGNAGGCSQLCFHSQIYNQSSNQTQTRTQCHCKSGFTLMDDGQTCQDNCVEGQDQCQQSCITTFGSFKCSCGVGYQQAPDQTSCSNIDECLLPVAVTGCIFGCINTPGSFHCQCPAGHSQHTADGHCQDIDECAVNQGLGPCMQQCHNSPGSYRCSCTYGYILAGDGHSCFAECPTGYRKQQTTPPANSTMQTLKEKCIDINECLEEMCEWQCINLPGSHRCICPRGYTLQKDGQHCKDINECIWKNGGCSHLCVNRRGGYKCACPASHRLSHYSWKTCLPRTTAYTTG